VDPCDGKHRCVNGRANAFQTWTVCDKAAQSEQSTSLDELDSTRCHAHADVLRANKLTRFHACFSAAEQTARGIQQ
jgi:hypothetical protein